MNLSHPELAEIVPDALPPASLENLKQLRANLTGQAKSTEFKLHPAQRFLRRILSPDSPARSLLLFHGTGVGKTCTAVQVAEEYIIRPEFQDKKVLVVSSSAVASNFQSTIFNMSRVNIDSVAGTLESKQCTGRRYLDMLLRIENDPKKWDKATQDRLMRVANRILDEFYEFKGYSSFGNMIKDKLSGTAEDIKINTAWVHEHFDNRLLIIDEAHNIRFNEKSTDSNSETKIITEGIKKLVQVADGLVVVFLSATPMYESFEEIMFYMNLFLWNDRKQDSKTELTRPQFFDENANFISPEKEQEFRDWCQTYVSFVKGDSPFTFPFRLPPPVELIADANELTTGYDGRPIKAEERVKYLPLVASEIKGRQKEVIDGMKDIAETKTLMLPTLCCLPKGKNRFDQVFRKGDNDRYIYQGEPFLSPDNLSNYSAKFASVIRSIVEGEGVVFVYSNYVEMGIRLFAMALEEHGFTPYNNKVLLENPTIKENRGKYTMFYADMPDDVRGLLTSINRSDNKNGERIRVILAGPVAAEGLDFRFVRQVHLLDPWWNSSRIEQAIGRGLRNGSHALLDFSKQNCMVYMHILRGGQRETYDEYVYRTKVEQKARKIAKIRKVMAESAIDCPLFSTMNTLPESWKTLPVPQKQSEGGGIVTYTLGEMMPPSFMDNPDVKECNVRPSEPDPDHTRPLSTYLDVRDELLDTLQSLFVSKPIWRRQELFTTLSKYDKEVVIYTLQMAIRAGHIWKDSFGRPSTLESKGELYALAPEGIANRTMVERTTKLQQTQPVTVTKEEKEEETEEEEEEGPPPPDIAEMTREVFDSRRAGYKWPGDASTRFSQGVLDGYVFDHLCSEEERLSILEQEWDILPYHRTYLDEGIWVRGYQQTKGYIEVYPSRNQALVREEAEMLEKWTSKRVERLIENIEKPIATLQKDKDGKYKFKMSDMIVVDNALKRGDTNRPLDTITAKTGKFNVEKLKAVAPLLDKEGVGFPDSVKKGDDLSTYLELLTREEHGCIWISPEEYSVLYEDKGMKDKVVKDMKRKMLTK